LEDLSDASFLGKLLVFPANVRLDCRNIRPGWKYFPGTKVLADLCCTQIRWSVYPWLFSRLVEYF
jgi:hypothetical protein